MHLRDASCFVHTFPLFRFVRCFAYHVCCATIFTPLLTCSCISLACYYVIHTSTQWSYGHLIQTYIFPLWRPLFVCLLTLFVCLFVCLFACFLVCLYILLVLSPATCYACHVYHIYLFMPLSYALCIFSFHCLSASFLSLPLHVCTWSEDAWS